MQTQSRVRHGAMDLLGLPGGLVFRTDDDPASPGVEGERDWTARMAVGPVQQGLDLTPLPDETASLWAHDGTWQRLAEGSTDAEGWVGFPAPPTEAGLIERTVVLDGDGTCTTATSLRLAAADRVVLTDIDGTLTISDEELFSQIGDPDYDPVAYAGAGDLMRAWARDGAAIIYMTARPHTLRNETRAWLETHGYPPGPLISSPTLVFGDDTRVYKTVWVERLVQSLGWDVVAAYGNAETDIDAYLSQLPPERVWIIGENAGEQGTNAVEGDWNGHLDGLF